MRILTARIVFIGGPCDGARRIIPSLRSRWAVPIEPEPVVPVCASNDQGPCWPACMWAVYRLEHDDAGMSLPSIDDQGCYRFAFVGITDSD